MLTSESVIFVFKHLIFSLMTSIDYNETLLNLTIKFYVHKSEQFVIFIKNLKNRSFKNFRESTKTKSTVVECSTSDRGDAGFSFIGGTVFCL